MDIAPATTIEQVIRCLDDIVNDTLARGSRAGYFAALYRKVTVRVKEQITKGFFADGPRMERLDVIFANRYLDAYARWRRASGDGPTEVWKLALDATETWRPLVLQHLLLGMNAHINLDLGIAAALTAPGPALAGLKGDFDRINTVLADLVGSVTAELTHIWPPLGWMTHGRLDDAVINFSMSRARDQAWSLAQALASLAPDARDARIRATDAEMSALGAAVLTPGFRLTAALLAIRIAERGSVAQKIQILSRPPLP
jgi:hypothetical protein